MTDQAPRDRSRALPAVPLNRVERALGLVVGPHPGVATLAQNSSCTPRQALEAVLLDALQRPPCLLSFSGGRDSSALLAIAAAVARKEGLQLPVPITLVFPGDAAADEQHWQSQVLDHLSVSERLTVRVEDDLLDVVGPAAREVMSRHGVLWPFNTHWHLPIVRQASGGTVVTGFGGDELALTSVALWAERSLTRRRPPSRKDLRAVIGAVSPFPVRFLRRLAGEDSALAMSPWLTPSGRRAAKVERALESARVPLGWSRVLRHDHWRSRWVQATVRNTAVMADWFDTRVVHPFAEPQVLQALAAAAPFAGLGGRSDLMRTLFGDLLPAQIITRSSKASFGASLWTETSRDFVAGWTGAGIEPKLVDAEALRRAWSDRTVSGFKSTLMQLAWFAMAPPPTGPERGR